MKSPSSDQTVLCLVLLLAGTAPQIHAFQSIRGPPCFLHCPRMPNDVIQARQSIPVVPDPDSRYGELQLQRQHAVRKSPFVGGIMASSSENNNGDNSGDQSGEIMSMREKVEGRKKRVTIGYRVAATIYLLLGISTFVPGFIKPSLMPMAMNYASGPLLAAGIAYILNGAAENDRLSSDTYKRLNLWLSLFGTLWLLAAVLVRQTVPLTKGAKIVSNPVIVLGGLASLVNGIKGWAYGAKGWDKAGNNTFQGDLTKLAKSSLEVVTPPIPNLKAGVYLAGTAFTVILKLLKASEFIQMLFGMGSEAATAAKYASWFIAFAKLQLLFMASFTLTDAAKRERLQGTTFIELNVMSAFAWIATGAFLFKSGNVFMSSLATLLSSFSLYVGVDSFLAKKQKATSK